MIDFKASSVSLEGSNLIEASAGTGKTYSIGILALRLILEKQIKIKEILMVTFTKAAVAELESRIRFFVKLAYKASCGDEIKDSTIKSIVDASILNYGHEKVKDLLNEAVLFLDETSVLTIHSFCQQTLTEFAFETDQLLGAETLQETLSIIEEHVNEFWRKNVTTIPADLLGQLVAEGLSRKTIISAAQNHIDGKRFLFFEKNKEYQITDEQYQQFALEIQALADKENILRQALNGKIEANINQLEILCQSNHHAKTSFLPLLSDPPAFLNQVWDKRGSNYVKSLFGDLLEGLEPCIKIAEQIKGKIQEVITLLQCSAISEITKNVQDFKLRNNLLSFDDMILKLHHALVITENKRVSQALAKKYKAVFIDEFQDTDRLQYEIFQQAFGNDTILFYIGDPKQSIYAWRKADIITYFKACRNAQNLYSMNENYRSTERFINAMNAFFLPKPDFDIFYFQDQPEAIKYHPVGYPESRTIPELTINREAVCPITIFELSNKKSICQAVAAQLGQLLESDDFLITDGEKNRKIRPSDIGILVRTQNEGKSIKSTLAKYGIPAITIDDTKILKSEEAAYVLYLLEAMLETTPGNIHKSLLSPLTGFQVPEILSLDDELIIGLFRKYRITWETDGVYNAIMTFIADFSIKKVLLVNKVEAGERIIANFFQLVEMLHKVQSNKQLSPAELISWLKRAIDGTENEGDEFEQRIESDEESVKIVTIHKSKGLEYNIVFAPFLDLLPINDFDFVSFRHKDSGDYVCASKASLLESHKEWLTEQLEQENRRLLYVALSRAVYKCFIFKNTSNTGRYNYNNSSLSVFLTSILAVESPLIEFITPPTLPDGYFYSKAVEWKPSTTAKLDHFNISQSNWAKLSYTRLAAKHEYQVKPLSGEPDNEYDLFTFKQLAKGQKTGNMLHYILERIHFNNSSRWKQVIAEAVTRFYPGQAAVYQPKLYEMIQYVLEAPIQIEGTSIKLSSIFREKCIHEFEFDFNVPLFNPNNLANLANEKMQIHIQGPHESEGIMNGKIDLFFEHDGKYYVLDWKSNFLGNSLNDYSPEAIANAMSEHNYHLQYLIYTLAIKKYLKSRIKNFDYEKNFGGVIYLFLRGVRSDSNTGIFNNKPSLALINSLESMVTKAENQLIEV